MIELRPNKDLSAVIQEEAVRALSVLRMAVGRHLSTAERRFFGRHSDPTGAERKELRELAHGSGLDGEFEVATDRVFSNGQNQDGRTVMRTEFHLFRTEDVPYLMSLKTAIEVMET